MDKTDVKNSLIVVEDDNLRYRLREEAKQLVLEKKITPPADFNQLQELAKELLLKTGLNHKYIDFATVICGNEVWRNVVAATPFNRRLLLLPQCLKNSSNCKGVLDNFGLICNNCKKCNISEIISKAEALGYSTLVAEGTTVAVKLVEEGAIDALIGVSCMHVLQRSFASVSKSALPAFGLPLLRNGCTDTEIDYKWLLEEINNSAANIDFQPLSVSVLKDQVLEYFTADHLKKIFYSDNETEQLAKRMLAMGGQRIRPLLSVLAYRSYIKNYSEDVQEKLAIIIECFHKASLIHDDIEDGDDYRYGQETLHKSHGIPCAINVGDFLIGKGYQLLTCLPVNSAILADSLKIIASSHLNLTVGQGSDLLLKNKNSTIPVEEFINIFSKKTGEAVKSALLLGAINGGAEYADIKRLEAFSDWFGIAYQIRDDLKEFNEEERREKKENFPFLVALLNEKMGTLASPDENPGNLHQTITEQQIDVFAEDYMNYYVDKCYFELDQLKNLKMKLSLYGIMGKIF